MSKKLETRNMEIEYHFQTCHTSDEFGSQGPWFDIRIESVRAYEQDTDMWEDVTDDPSAVRVAERLVEEYEQDNN